MSLLKREKLQHAGRDILEQRVRFLRVTREVADQTDAQPLALELAHRASVDLALSASTG
jgi:hypothetical protein